MGWQQNPLTNSDRNNDSNYNSSHWKQKRFRINQKNAPYLFIAPVVILFLFFTVYPVISSFLLSFKVREQGHYIFSGLSNYIQLFQDPLFYHALINTVIIFVFSVPVTLFLALILAVGLNAAMVKLKSVFRVLYFLPVVTSLVAASILFLFLLNENYGLVNFLLSHIGIPKINWFSNPFWAKVTVALVIVWRWTGYNMVIYLAGLQTISKDLYEAASIDGAGKLRQFFSITVPQLKPIFIFTLVLSVISNFQLFDEPYTLTDGGPNNATLTVTLYLYQNGFEDFNFGYASAIAYVLVLLIAILSWIQLKWTGDDES